MKGQAFTEAGFKDSFRVAESAYGLRVFCAGVWSLAEGIQGLQCNARPCSDKGFRLQGLLAKFRPFPPVATGLDRTLGSALLRSFAPVL